MLMFALIVLVLAMVNSFEKKVQRMNEIYEAFKLNMEEVQHLKDLVSKYTNDNVKADAEVDKTLKLVITKLSSDHRAYERLKSLEDQILQLLQKQLDISTRLRRLEDNKKGA